MLPLQLDFLYGHASLHAKKPPSFLPSLPLPFLSLPRSTLTTLSHVFTPSISATLPHDDAEAEAAVDDDDDLMTQYDFNLMH